MTFRGFVMDLPVGAWLITAPGGSDGPPRILRQCASERECRGVAARYGLPDLVFVQVGAAMQWRAGEGPEAKVARCSARQRFRTSSYVSEWTPCRLPAGHQSVHDFRTDAEIAATAGAR